MSLVNQVGRDVLLGNTVYLQQRVDTVNTLLTYTTNPLTLNALTHNEVEIFVECFIDLIETLLKSHIVYVNSLVHNNKLRTR